MKKSEKKPQREKAAKQRCEAAAARKMTKTGGLEAAKADLPDDRTLYSLAEFFNLFGDTTRVKILCALFNSELCVGDIAELLNLTQSAASHQLRMLRNGRLVRCRRDGKTIYYSLNDDHVVSIIGQGMDHVTE
jgi:DNA-binding transcriptional ArsR family regulator